MLLNQSLLGLSYIHQPVTLETRNIASKGGLFLPLELWHEILDNALADVKPNFCFVQAMSFKDRVSRKVLQCERLELLGGTLAGSLESVGAVAEYEDFLKNPQGKISTPFTTPNLQSGSDTGNTLDYVASSAMISSKLDCLFTDLTVADIFGYIEGGNFLFCRSKRCTCVGNTRKRAAFNLRITHGPVIACPLCLGTTITEQHEKHLQVWAHPFAIHSGLVGPCPKEELDRIDRMLQNSLDKLATSGLGQRDSRCAVRVGCPWEVVR